MKIEIEITKEEGVAFMLVHSVGLAVLSGQFEKAISRASGIRALGKEHQQLSGSMMRKLCMAIDSDSAIVANADERARLDRN